MVSGFYNDDDIKIAPNDLSKLFEKENPVADDNIELYLRQRSLGNIARARKLGSQYVADMLDCVWTKAPEGTDPEVFDTQLKILFAYSVHRIVEDYSENHIVANTAIESFHSRLEQEDPAVFNSLCDQAAFSMYLYAHRSGHENAQSIGEVFASLCGAKNDESCILLGESAYARFTGACAQRMVEAGYRTLGGEREGKVSG